MLSHSFHNLMPKSKRNAPEIYFVGNNISSTYIADLLEVIEGKEISVNVISKSGTTTEPAIAFRIFKSTWKTNTEKTEQVKEYMPLRQGERSTQEAGNRRGI